MNGGLSADDLVTVGAAVFHALVHTRHMLLQLMVQREAFPAEAAAVRLYTLRRMSPEQ